MNANNKLNRFFKPIKNISGKSHHCFITHFKSHELQKQMKQMSNRRKGLAGKPSAKINVCHHDPVRRLLVLNVN
jgi:hypothetical protein